MQPLVSVSTWCKNLCADNSFNVNCMIMEFKCRLIWKIGTELRINSTVTLLKIKPQYVFFQYVLVEICSKIYFNVDKCCQRLLWPWFIEKPGSSTVIPFWSFLASPTLQTNQRRPKSGVLAHGWMRFWSTTPLAQSCAGTLECYFHSVYTRCGPVSASSFWVLRVLCVPFRPEECRTH